MKTFLTLALTITTALLAPSAATAQTVSAATQECVGTAHWQWSQAAQTFTVNHSYPTCFSAAAYEEVARLFPVINTGPTTGFYGETSNTTAITCANTPVVATLSYSDGQPGGWRGTGVFAGATAAIAYTTSQPAGWTRAQVVEHVFPSVPPLCSSPDWSGTSVTTFQLAGVGASGL